MALYTSLLALSALIAASHGKLLDRVPTPGVVSMRYSKESSHLQRRDGSVAIPFGAQYDDYLVNITAGTPPQSISLGLDTGSSDMILVTEETSWCSNNTGYCASVGYYNSKKSSTYKALPGKFASLFGFQNQSEGSGVTGTLATDTFTFAGTTIKDQEFAIADTNTTIGQSILGLGYAAGESQWGDPPPKPYDNFPLSLAKQGATNLALFSLYKDAPTGVDGTLLFGGVDTGKYTGSLQTLQTQNRTGFNATIGFDVLLDGLALSGDSSFPKAAKGPVAAVLDCGTATTILPDDWVTPIHKQFDIKYFDANDTAYVDCSLRDEPYTLNFTFQELTLSMQMSSLVTLRAINPDVCTFGLVPAISRFPILGDNFLSNAYTVFDITNNQISLGVRDFSSTAENVITVPSGGVKALGSKTVNPSGSAGTGTPTGSSASATSSKAGGASSASVHAYVVGVSLLGTVFLGLNV